MESHRTLAAPTRSACSQAASAPSSPPSPGAWVVLLPSGDVVCFPEDLDLDPSPSPSPSSPSSGTCSVAAAAGAGAGAAAGEAQACRASPTTVPASDAGGRPPESGASSGGTLAFDHVYPSRGGRVGGGGGGSGGIPGNGYGDGGGDAGPLTAQKTTTAVLYGVVGSPAMMGFHRVLKAKAEAGTVRYAFRHALPYGDGEDRGHVMETSLQGYGVVLDVKNMEYQSFDSSDSEDEVRARVFGARDRINDSRRQKRITERGSGSGMDRREQATLRQTHSEPAPNQMMTGSAAFLCGTVRLLAAQRRCYVMCTLL